MDCVPFPVVCFQCGTDQNPCHCKVVGPTLGFIVTVCAAIVCWPASLLCCCCATDAGKSVLAAPVDMGNSVNRAIPI
ncbi:hypothetical protein BU24DRAFT_419789 [Aaosphaeria arxii CBS 175.79]|uniref:Uncharacterized protein n=1 Tax=Aaosphaeria arxii CBS 175.79 TaxID=1450172 RepID=A0A6A5Y6P6_9PLEO|nr:uncharacterized protein BU24DRAFT_419789 [Aaosphaeria arxii CBS 175.79]KAF2020234.1 hypothetical protein BU24DRAFT_419789 [Aaosphaeria arxii CBS 175.79]